MIGKPKVSLHTPPRAASITNTDSRRAHARRRGADRSFIWAPERAVLDVWPSRSRSTHGCRMQLAAVIRRSASTCTPPHPTTPTTPTTRQQRKRDPPVRTEGGATAMRQRGRRPAPLPSARRRGAPQPRAVERRGMPSASTERRRTRFARRSCTDGPVRDVLHACESVSCHASVAWPVRGAAVLACLAVRWRVSCPATHLWRGLCEALPY